MKAIQVKQIAAGLALAMIASVCAHGQSAAVAPAQTGTPSAEQTQPAAQQNSKPQKKTRGAGAEVGSGAGDVGKGAAKGAGDLTKGTGKGAVDLATLHPINAATDIGKGAGEAGGHVAVGTAKGTGKVVKGTAKAIKKVF